MLLQGCSQIAKATREPPAAVLRGLLIIISFILSPGVYNLGKGVGNRIKVGGSPYGDKASDLEVFLYPPRYL